MKDHFTMRFKLCSTQKGDYFHINIFPPLHCGIILTSEMPSVCLFNIQRACQTVWKNNIKQKVCLPQCVFKMFETIPRKGHWFFFFPPLVVFHKACLLATWWAFLHLQLVLINHWPLRAAEATQPQVSKTCLPEQNKGRKFPGEAVNNCAWYFKSRCSKVEACNASPILAAAVIEEADADFKWLWSIEYKAKNKCLGRIFF